VSKLYTDVKDYSAYRLKNKLIRNPEIASDMNNNHTQTDAQMYVGFLLKGFKLVIIIFNLSFFLGIFWLIFCESTQYLFDEYNDG